MKRAIIEIEIIKKEQSSEFYLNKSLYSLEDITQQVKGLKEKIVLVQTIEEERVLFSGYLLFKNTKQFKKHLFFASKAQIKI